MREGHPPPPWGWEDEGAGCSEYDELPEGIAKKPKMAKPGLEAMCRVWLKVIPDDPRECRRQIAEQVFQFGEEVWAEAKKRKGWE